MERPIDDIKKIRELTEYEFSLSVCKNAYEKCGRNIESAIELLKSGVPVQKPDMTEEEIAALKKYQKQAEKRAKKKAKKSLRSRRLLESKVYYGFSLAFFLMGVASVIIEIAEHGSIGVWLIIFSFAAALITAFIGASFKTMTDDDYKKYLEEESYVYNDGTCEIRCPRCGGINIVLKPKKFSSTKALFGIFLTGKSYGAAFGVPSNKRVKARCSSCGKRFTVINK